MGFYIFLFPISLARANPLLSPISVSLTSQANPLSPLSHSHSPLRLHSALSLFPSRHHSPSPLPLAVALPFSLSLSSVAPSTSPPHHDQQLPPHLSVLPTHTLKQSMPYNTNLTRVYTTNPTQRETQKQRKRKEERLTARPWR